jgi:ubiquinone/menaquinone biosynthesis C-methylase UbiE
MIEKKNTKNVDPRTVSDFGSEWSVFDQSDLTHHELQIAFEEYFSLVDWGQISDSPVIMDVGCGSGRWAVFVAPKAGKMLLVDPAQKALDVARIKMSAFKNCEFHLGTTEELPVEDDSCDFVYSLGVLHHIPDTYSGIEDCVRKLKPGAPFLVYLYYRFDNRPLWFRALWQISNLARLIFARLPFQAKHFSSAIIAGLIYLPLARTSRFAEKCGMNVSVWPLSFYRQSSFYRMRTDALDRFGTRLEHRFTQDEIQRMLTSAGLEKISFRETEPFWCAIGYKTR